MRVDAPKIARTHGRHGWIVLDANEDSLPTQMGTKVRMTDLIAFGFVGRALRSCKRRDDDFGDDLVWFEIVFAFIFGLGDQEKLVQRNFTIALWSSQSYRSP